jgi:hypothetical protein
LCESVLWTSWPATIVRAVSRSSVAKCPDIGRRHDQHARAGLRYRLAEVKQRAKRGTAHGNLGHGDGLAAAGCLVDAESGPIVGRRREHRRFHERRTRARLAQGQHRNRRRAWRRCGRRRGRPFVPRRIRCDLDEASILPNVPSFPCVDDRPCEFVRANVDKLLGMPANESGGCDMFIGPSNHRIGGRRKPTFKRRPAAASGPRGSRGLEQIVDRGGQCAALHHSRRTCTAAPASMQAAPHRPSQVFCAAALLPCVKRCEAVQWIESDRFRAPFILRSLILGGLEWIAQEALPARGVLRAAARL